MPRATFSKLSTRLLLTTAFILTALRLASAQENSVSSPLPRFGYYAGYLVSIHTSSPTFYNFSGFNALDHTSSPVGFDLDLIWNLNQRIAIRGGLSGSYTKETGGLSVPCGQSMCAQSSSLTPHIYRFVGGPEFRIRAGRVSPFAYALLGLAHSTAPLTHPAHSASFRRPVQPLASVWPVVAACPSESRSTSNSASQWTTIPPSSAA